MHLLHPIHKITLITYNFHCEHMKKIFTPFISSSNMVEKQIGVCYTQQAYIRQALN